MSHEAVHVATEAATNNTMPLWLLEGFADYVALLDVDLPVSTAAGQIIDRVRKDGPPENAAGSRPSSTPPPPTSGATYESAWLACRLLAGRGGEPALVELYMRVGAGASLGRALQDRFGLTEAELTQPLAGPADQLAAVTEGDRRAPVASPARPSVGRRPRAHAPLVPLDPVPGGDRYRRPRRPRSSPRDQIAAAEAFSRHRAGCGSAAAGRLPGDRLRAGLLAPGPAARRRRSPDPWWVRVPLAVAALALARSARHPAVRAAPSRPPPSTTASPPRPGAAFTARPREGRGHPKSSSPRWRCWWWSGPPVAGARAWPAVDGGVLGRLRPARLPRLPGPGRAALQPLRAAAGRSAALPDPRARRPGGRGGRRRPGRRRLPAHDDAERLRLGVRHHPPGGRLRQPGRGPAARTSRSRWSRTSSAHARHRGRPARLAARSGWRAAASACWGWWSGTRRGPGHGRSALVPLVLALVALAGVPGLPGAEPGQPPDRDPRGRRRAPGDAGSGRLRGRCRSSWRSGP